MTDKYLVVDTATNLIVSVHNKLDTAQDNLSVLQRKHPDTKYYVGVSNSDTFVCKVGKPAVLVGAPIVKEQPAKKVSLLSKVAALCMELNDEFESALPAELDTLSASDIVDLHGMYSDALKQIKSLLLHKQASTVASLVSSLLPPDLQPLETTTLMGNSYQINVGVCAKNSTIVKDKEYLFDALGKEIFLAIAKVTVADVQTYCTPEESAKILDTNTGYSATRRMTIVRKK